MLAHPVGLLAIEADLREVEQHERREDLDLVVADGGDGEREETVRLVAAEDVEAERAAVLAVDDQVDRPSDVDPTDSDRQGEQLLGAPHGG